MKPVSEKLTPLKALNELEIDFRVRLEKVATIRKALTEFERLKELFRQISNPSTPTAILTQLVLEASDICKEEQE